MKDERSNGMAKKMKKIKLKTKKAAAKRLRMTKSGLFKKAQCRPSAYFGEKNTQT